MSAITGLVDALAGKAALGHGHSFDDLSDVSGMAGAADGYIPVKQGSGWVPGSPASIIGSHQHPISDVVNLSSALDGKAALAGAAFTGAVTLAGAPSLSGHAANKGYVDASLPAQIAAGADEDFADTTLLVGRKANGSIVKRAFSAVKAQLNTYFKGLGGLSVASGHLLYGSGADALATLAPGVNGQFLSLAAGLPAWANLAGGIGNVTTQFFTSSGTYTPTPGMKFALVFAQAGGGGSPYLDRYQASSGGGGGACAIAVVTAAQVAASKPVTIGGGGGQGATGGTTSLGALASAAGGQSGGVGGSAGIGAMIVRGGRGQPSGAAAYIRGCGGDSFFGMGAAGSSSSGSYGGGAGGSYTNDDTQGGYSGAAGCMLIIEFS